jgi:hypothetical protein
MKKNQGMVDRGIRIGIGSIVLIVGIVLSQTNITGMFIAMAIGLILLISGMVGICPLYGLIPRFNTLPDPTKAEDNNIYGRSYNSNRTEPRFKRYDQRPSSSIHRDTANKAKRVDWVSGSEARAASNRTSYRNTLSDKRSR